MRLRAPRTSPTGRRGRPEAGHSCSRTGGRAHTALCARPPVAVRRRPRTWRVRWPEATGTGAEELNALLSGAVSPGGRSVAAVAAGAAVTGVRLSGGGRRCGRGRAAALALPGSATLLHGNGSNDQ